MVKELAHFRDNEVLDRIKAQLQNFLCGELSTVQKNSFVESYKREETSFCIHCRSRVRGFPFEFCAVVHGLKGEGSISVGLPNRLNISTLLVDQIEVSVLVEIRELREPPQVPRFIPISGVVRLYSLDEFKNIVGNPGHFPLECTPRSWGNLWGKQMQREGAFSLPVPGELCPVGFIDETEREVIDGRPELINEFSDQNGEGKRWINQDAESFFFSVRVVDNLIRLCSGVRGNAILDGAEMFRCPKQFEVDGFDYACHDASVARDIRELKG
ncbi:MAG TPA: hypothetical protein VFA90_19885 [Terriglobales bacterium]|nr:hypothetical protein [Terriglobales bacterium]